MLKVSQKNLITKVYKNIVAGGLITKGDTVIVALSGGPDSVCLFDILYSLREKLEIGIKAAHFNHKLRGQASEADEKFVRKLCVSYKVELFVSSMENKINNKNVSEETAREARYAFFSKILKSGRGDTKIALAHNSKDLAETFLMRIIRGTGLKGLKSIPSQRENFIRPLLKFSRDEIIGYLEDRNIKYRTDKSNLDTKYLRNKIRLELLPKLTKINPKIIEALGISSLSIGDDYDYLENEGEKLLSKIIERENASQIVIERKSWISLHPAMQRLTLRLSIEKLDGGTDINFIHIESARMLILKGEGKKGLPLPHHLQIQLTSGKINILRTK